MVQCRGLGLSGAIDYDACPFPTDAVSYRIHPLPRQGRQCALRMLHYIELCRTTSADPASAPGVSQENHIHTRWARHISPCNASHADRQRPRQRLIPIDEPVPRGSVQQSFYDAFDSRLSFGAMCGVAETSVLCGA